MTSRGGNSINDLFYSPFEKLKLGYINPKTVNFTNNSSYIIGDISCRTTNNEVLKVPINSTEYFLIENRRKVSEYDVKMLGDTTRLKMSFNSGEYGKGIYIYHIQSVNNQYSHEQDQECADGIWDWEVSGTAIPDWSESGTLPLLKRINLSNPINNDNGNWGSLNNKDGISANYIGGAGVYFSLGKRNTAVGLKGTDKVFTNYPEFWTSRELWGDRLDVWNTGYNEIFSPYSNPNTKDWTNTKTGIFIYYYSLNDGNAKLKVYKENDPFTETEILAITPPSKPMGINVDYYTETENYIRPIITWNHNQEPDMLRPDSLKKRYYIWRAVNQNMTVVPVDYSLLDTVDIDSGTAPSYIDHSVFGYGSSWPGMGQMEQYPLRYTVQAVDKYDDVSVRSDFGMAIGIKNCTQCIGVVEDHLMNDPLPTEYSLNQNFPNPFNPETHLEFGIPNLGFVSFKVYDILGKEVKTLIYEIKNPGRYKVVFDGSSLPSGIYYYKIDSGNFSQVRKMILIR